MYSKVLTTVKLLLNYILWISVKPQTEMLNKMYAAFQKITKYPADKNTHVNDFTVFNGIN